MRIYGFQITPGSNRSFGYCESAARAYEQAREHRENIRRAARSQRVEPIAVYEIELANVTAEALVTVLNNPDTLTEAFTVSKRVLGYVAET